MSGPVHHRDTCRLCDSTNMHRVVELEQIPLSEGYTLDPESALKAPRYPIDVHMCGDCGHVQQSDVIDTEVLWDSYTYISGDAQGVHERCLRVAGMSRG